jgi:hypothetical protein
LQGVGAALVAIAAFETDEHLSADARRTMWPFAICNKEKVSGLQLRQVFVNWAEKNPTDWQKQEFIGAWSAIQDAWPCPLPSPPKPRI